MKQWGDKIEKVAKPIAKAFGQDKPCEGCQKRKEILNHWSRRGFIGGITTALAAAMAPKLSAAQEESAITALQTMRFLNTAQAWHRNHTGGTYALLRDLFESQSVGDLQNDEFAEKKGIGKTLIAKLDVDRKQELLTGWTFNFKLSPDGRKYTATLNNSDFVFKTDETAIIKQDSPVLLNSWRARLSGMLLRCVGANGDPWCCCTTVPCCDQCFCCNNQWQYCYNQGCKYNCGCPCCIWCCVDNC